MGNKIERIDNIRERLGSFVSYEEGIKLRAELKEIADLFYIQKHSHEEHVMFLCRHRASFDDISPQSSNHPFVVSMFTCLTQHIYADNVIQLLDKAVDIENEIIKSKENGK